MDASLGIVTPAGRQSVHQSRGLLCTDGRMKRLAANVKTEKSMSETIIGGAAAAIPAGEHPAVLWRVYLVGLQPATGRFDKIQSKLVLQFASRERTICAIRTASSHEKSNLHADWVALGLTKRGQATRIRLEDGIGRPCRLVVIDDGGRNRVDAVLPAQPGGAAFALDGGAVYKLTDELPADAPKFVVEWRERRLDGPAPAGSSSKPQRHVRVASLVDEQFERELQANDEWVAENEIQEDAT